MDDRNNLQNGSVSEQELNERIAKLDKQMEAMSKRLNELSTQPKKTNAQSPLNKKLVATMCATFALIFSLSICSYAYFVSTTSSGGNIISTGYASVILHNETDPSYPTQGDTYMIYPGYSVGKSVYVENIGAYPIYVRAKIVGSINLNERYASHEDEIDLSLINYSIDYDNWTERDGYYYFNTAVISGKSTTNLLSSVDFSNQMGNIYKDSTIKVKILLEVVQANNNGDTVFDAVGWSSAEEGGSQ